MNIIHNRQGLHFIAVTMERQATAYFALAFFALSFQTIDAALYEISIDSFEPYSGTDPNFVDYGTLRVSKKSRNVFVIDGKFEFFENMDDDTRSVFQIFLGDNTQPTMSGNMGFCEAISNDSKVQKSLREMSNLPGSGVCPFPKGKYHIDKYQLDESQLPLMIAPGKYTLIVQMVQNDQIKGGYKLRVTIK